MKPILLLAVLGVLASCAGFSTPGEDEALAVVEALNAGRAEELTERSGLPFAFDGEILASDSQIRQLWTGMTRAGFVLDDPRVVEERSAAPADASLFSDSWEMKTYFETVLGGDDMLFRLEGAGGEMTLILRNGPQDYRIMALKGDAR